MWQGQVVDTALKFIGEGGSQNVPELNSVI